MKDETKDWFILDSDMPKLKLPSTPSGPDSVGVFDEEVHKYKAVWRGTKEEMNEKFGIANE